MKTITPHFDRSSGRLEVEYQAAYDGNTIGFFRTHHEAEVALDDYVFDLAQQGLLDASLAEMGDDEPWSNNPCSVCGETSDLAIANLRGDGHLTYYCNAHEPAETEISATPDTDPFADPRTPEEIAWSTEGWAECAGGWEKFGPHPFDPARTVRHFRQRLFAEPSGPPPSDPPGYDPIPGTPPEPGRAIARHWHKTPRRFLNVLRELDPVIWWSLAEAYSAWRGCSTQHTLDIWLLAVQGTNVPANAHT